MAFCSLSISVLSDGVLRTNSDTQRVNVHDHIFKLANGESLRVIDKVNFALPTDSFSCIVDPSGSGKTIVLRMILGLDNSLPRLLLTLWQSHPSTVLLVTHDVVEAAALTSDS